MSVATPVICSNVGGNCELIEGKYIFKKGDIDSIAKLISYCMNTEVLTEMSNRNFEKSKNYNRTILDKKRNNFFNDFMRVSSK